MTSSIIIKGLNVYTEKAILPKAAVAIDNAIISQIGNDFSKNNSAKIFEFPPSWHLIPGMIDMHVHGAAGADTMDATYAALDTMSKALVQEGVTAFLPTTMTAPISDIEAALINVRNYLNAKSAILNENKFSECTANRPEQFEFIQKNIHDCCERRTKQSRNSKCNGGIDGAEILGINLEGPFLSPLKTAAHSADAIISPDINLFNTWQQLSHNLIKVTTVAPEVPNGLEFIKYLNAHGVIAAIGHSDADCEQAQAAINAGSTQATHLFNAMPSIHHRAPGLVTALLLDDRIVTEVIADLIHLHPAILKLIFKVKGCDKIILITDAMRAKYLPEGIYDLGGQKVMVKNNSVRLELKNDTLAGSVLKMDTAIRNMIHHTGCSLQDTIKMTAENPAKQLKIFEHKGSIAIGKDADLVVLDDTLQVRMTICKGKIVYQT